MTTRAETSLQNFAGGELSPKMRGRYDLPLYFTGCERLFNFIAETQGPAKFRTGTRYVLHTRRNNIAALIPFQFNDQQAYILEFTDGYMRIHKDGAVVVQADKTITGATAANPVVITSVAHGYSNGDEVFIQNVVGMTQLNGKSYIVKNVAANTFELTDQDGNNVNGTGYTAYASGGVAQKIVEVVTPYREADDLFKLKYTQNADTMYIVHPYYEPRKLTRASHTSWTFSLFSRTADPFTSQKTITGASQANPCAITAVGHGYSTGDIVIIEGIVGMTQLNSRYYTITKVDADHFTLDGVDSSAYTAYSSGGYASNRNLLPACVAFYESRIFYAATALSPQNFWGSRAPDSSGNTRYDDFTTGTDADHAVVYSIASREVNKIHWLAGADRALLAGTFGAEFKITGSTADEAISPTSINVRPIAFFGVDDQAPINKENSVIYIQRGARTLRSFEFDALADSFVSVDRNLVSDHITLGGVKQIAYQAGRPDVVWCVKNTGELIGVTFKSREDVSGWHRHETNGGDDLFESIAIMPQVNGFDQVWVIVNRTIDGHTRRYVEYFTDEITIPEFIDYFTSKSNRAEDEARFRRAMFEAQKGYVHVDAALTYDGTDPGVNAGATVTPAAVSGTSVLFTASASVFKSTDVGRQIWKKSILGEGYGRAEITGYTSGTQVTCNILEAFDSAVVMAAGDWYLTTDSISGLEHLEGESVSIVTDGSVHPIGTVAAGVVELDYQAGMVHIGLGYTGILKSMNIEVGGTTGPSQTKKKNIHEMGIRFLNTLGCAYGTDPYDLDDIPFRSSADVINRPPPLFSGDKKAPVSDNWDEEKHIVIQQKQPLPCIVQMVVPYVTTSNG